MVLYFYGGCRKLAEIGFKRTAEKCKEKFEEESRYFNTNIDYTKNYRFLTELEELYHGNSYHQNPQVVGAEKSQKLLVVDKPISERKEEEDKRGENVEKESKNNEEKMMMMMMMEEKVAKRKKRKRHKIINFEIFKGFCEDIVNKMMAQQEVMHNKLLEEMVKRDEEKIAKEEAWKKQEIVRMNKELEIMAHEQALAGDRQATIIDFLKKFTSTTSSSSGEKVTKSSNPINIIPPTSSSSIQPPQNPNPTSSTTLAAQQEPIVPSKMILDHHQNSDSLTLVVTQNPSSPYKLPTTTTTTSPLASKNPNSLPFTPTSSSSSIQKVPQNPSSNEKDHDIGKRWPRDEVLALINLRCNALYNSCSGDQDKEGVRAPLWERISQAMVGLGYKRSAKRCKEKWENINKYFRKTKDVNKKRSLDSRTCPYFHQLSTLYNNQGTTTTTAGPPHQLQANSPESHSSALPDSGQGGNSSSQAADSSNLHDIHQGERNMVPVSSAFDFQF